MTSDVETTVQGCIEALERGSTTAPVVEGLKPLAPALRALAEQNTGWRCFHCDALFLDREAAERHFGTRLRDAPLCAADQFELVATRRERDEYGDMRARAVGEADRLRRQVVAAEQTMLEMMEVAKKGDAEIFALLKALEPFATFADPHKRVPPSFPITVGSSIARKQLTMADCYAALSALGASAARLAAKP